MYVANIKIDYRHCEWNLHVRSKKINNILLT